MLRIDPSEAEVVVFKPLGEAKFKVVARVAAPYKWTEWAKSSGKQTDLAIHDVFHPLGQRRCDGPAARRHLVHHVGEGHAAIHVDNHQRAAVTAPGTHPAFRGRP